LHALSRATFFRPVQCTFYGFDPDDDYSLSVNRLSRELGLEQIVRFEPFVERNRLPSVLSNIDMLLIPSEWDEVGPLVMYEALSLGVPVAATALGAPAEVLPSVKNSYLLPYDANSWQAFLTDLSRGRISLHRSVYYSRSFSELASEVASSVYSSLIN
jgi:glycosyltransferase involved in cell wall biosynthesis